MTNTPEIDPRNNIASHVAESEASQTRSRATDGGPIMSDAPTAEEGKDGVFDGHITGTSQGGMLDGVTISDKDAEEAVPGDTGVELPGERRDR